MKKQKVIVYVDGFNFYYGLKTIASKDKSWKKFYWLDIITFFEKMLTDKQELVEVNYFSARPHDINSSKRQDLLFSANKLNSKFHLILGKYLKKDIICNRCGNTIHSYEEKETDVRIATQIINNAYKGKCNITIIVSADSDIIPSVELIREINPSHRVYVYFPPLRYSVSLSNSCDSERKLSNYKARFNQSMLPDKVTLLNGTVINRPANWN
ncbi:6-hydroxy-3-succinoylpyridine 3-monooxygenase HspA [termite gut metagenome]|uniref:6-hydroxy-3-succinoylpyridine 3-monooxygenase HspA n=1 Tax=termite gut metagenome TaxID=433724 RepID=A0A5J4PGN9_9ZZZZ